MHRLTEWVPRLTGGGSGLGREVSRGLAAAGTHVLVADISLEGAKATVGLVKESGGA